jgi:hypothetical protein
MDSLRPILLMVLALGAGSLALLNLTHLAVMGASRLRLVAMTWLLVTPGPRDPDDSGDPGLLSRLRHLDPPAAGPGDWRAGQPRTGRCSGPGAGIAARPQAAGWLGSTARAGWAFAATSIAPPRRPSGPGSSLMMKAKTPGWCTGRPTRPGRRRRRPRRSGAPTPILADAMLALLEPDVISRHGAWPRNLRPPSPARDPPGLRQPVLAPELGLAARLPRLLMSCRRNGDLSTARPQQNAISRPGRVAPGSAITEHVLTTTSSAREFLQPQEWRP